MSDSHESTPLLAAWVGLCIQIGADNAAAIGKWTREVMKARQKTEGEESPDVTQSSPHTAEYAEYAEMKAAFQYVCDRAGYDYVDAYLESLNHHSAKRPDVPQPDVPLSNDLPAPPRFVKLAERIRGSRGALSDLARMIWDEARAWVASRDKNEPSRLAGVVMASKAPLQKQLAERDAEIERLRASALYDGLEAMRDENSKLRAELAEARTPVDDTDEWLTDTVQLKRWVPEYQFHLERAARIEAERERDDLKAELAEARKPADDVDWSQLYDGMINDSDNTPWRETIERHVSPLLRHYHNARLEAERQRDELREAHRMFIALWTDPKSMGGEGYRVQARDFTDLSESIRAIRRPDPNDAVLAAYRANRKEGQSQ